MTIRYQLAFIGNRNSLEKNILDSIYLHLQELGIEKHFLVILDENNFSSEYKSNAPFFGLYFGDTDGDFKNIDLIDRLIRDGSLILPIFYETGKFERSIPDQLHKINGFEFSSTQAIEPLVNLILENLGLLRIGRKLFVSYKRDESSIVAIQLFEQLEKNGFDVFLDTHSIRPAEPFQDELWHRLADSEIVVLLNTPGFLTSNWTKDELARANAMQIGILQLIWPSHKMEVSAAISIPFQMKDSDFGNKMYSDQKSYLVDETIKRVVVQAEYLRARSLAARQDNIITEFMKAARKVGKSADLHPQRFIQTKKKDGEDIILIPTVGVPQAFSYNRSDEFVDTLNLSKKPNIYLLYDHIYIRDNWLKHLDWLDRHLPIKGVKITNAEKWLQNI